ncbi:MAG TPA: dephospho-CoA kinase [Bacteroides sp.]|mgnify:CR=1 FL=1|nr:dephospho-CoA kinase [Bacteroides sp.]
MLQVGITGGIGSGKTLVCRVFEKLGIPVYHADAQAKWLMDHRENLKTEIRDLLGAGSYRDGRLDREYVAGQVFRDPELLNGLNAIVHPAVRNHYLAWMKRQTEVPYVIEEAAILFESGAHRFMDMTILVYAPEDLRIRRVMERDQVQEEEVRLRMTRQMPEAEKKKKADAIIVNDEKEMLLPQIIALHRSLLNKKQRSW